MRSAMFLLCIAVISPAFPAKPDDSAVDKIFPAYDKPASPGCSLGVIRDGSFVYRRGYGEGSLELAVPLTSESVFYMGVNRRAKLTSFRRPTLTRVYRSFLTLRSPISSDRAAARSDRPKAGRSSFLFWENRPHRKP